MTCIVGTFGIFAQFKHQQNVPIALLNEHVLHHAGDNDTFLVKSDGGTVTLGKQLKPKCFDDNISGPNLDAGVARVDKKLEKLCCNVVIDPNGKAKLCKVYDGTIAHLYGKPVFKCQPPNDQFDFATARSDNTRFEGEIAKESEHLEHGIDTKHFLVRNGPMPFSVESESGTMVALYEESPEVVLVGQVSGGYLKTDSGYKYTLCTFLPEVFKFLRQKHRRDVELYKVRQLSCIEGDSVEKFKEMILPGMKITCQITEVRGSGDFQLGEHVLTLLNAIGVKPMDKSDLALFKSWDSDLSEKIFDRKEIGNASVFDQDGAHIVSLKSCKMACAEMYGGRYREAEGRLKQALKCVARARAFLLAIFCKVVSDIRWYYLDTDDLEVTEKILQNCDDFIAENDGKVGFPKEFKAFQYFSYARFFQKSGNKSRAIEMARKSVNCFRELYKEELVPVSASRLVCSLSLLATLLLGTGVSFETHQTSVALDFIEMAEECVEEINSLLPRTSSAVPTVNYFRVKTDLLFRKGDFVNASQCAQEGLTIALRKDVKREIRNFKVRCKVLGAQTDS